jgi:4-carboxymuconolactone decarboxylase
MADHLEERAKLEIDRINDPQWYERGLEMGLEINGPVFLKILEDLKKIDALLAHSLVEYAYGQTYARPATDLKTKELCTVAALTAMDFPDQLKTHVFGSLNAGATRDEVKEVIIHMHLLCGWPACIKALRVYQEAIEHLDMKRRQAESAREENEAD